MKNKAQIAVNGFPILMGAAIFGYLMFAVTYLALHG